MDAQRFQDIANALHHRMGPDCQLTLAIWEDEDPAPYVGSFGNATGRASMLKALLAQTLTCPRPTDCAGCAAAWDAMKLAHACLSAPLVCD